MYPSRILDRAKVILHDKMGSTSFSNSDLLELLNDFVDVAVHDVRRKFKYFGAKTTTIAQVEGTLAYSLPTDLEHFLSLRETAGLPDTIYELYPVDLQTLESMGVAFTYENAWKLNFVNADTTAGWTLMYTHKPVRCHTGTFSAIGDTTGTLATTATLGTVEQVDDYYNNADLFDTTNFKKWRITDYVGTGTDAKKATTGWTASTKPSGTPTYEILPMIDCDQFQAYLAWGLALSVMAIDWHDSTLRPASHPCQQAKRRFDNYWSSIQMRMENMFPETHNEIQ